MAEVHFGVVCMDGGWTVIGSSLRTRPFSSQAQAEKVARRFADEVIGRRVVLHVQGADGELRRATPVEAFSYL